MLKNQIMLNKSYVQSILNFFSSMNIDNLRLFLSERYSYANTTQEIFLNEIERIFENYRNSGDTELLIYEGTSSGRNLIDQGKKGYRFVGNNSRNYLDLIFDIDKDDIKDISSGELIMPDAEISDLGTKADFYIKMDDQNSSFQNPEYWSYAYIADIAISEISQAKQLNLQELGLWINKYSLLYSKLQSNIFSNVNMKWCPFVGIYDDLMKVWEYISKHISEITEANRIINQTDNEQDIINWVVKYEKVYDEAPLLSLIAFEHKGNDIHIYNKKVVLIGDEFSQTSNFEQSYSEHNHKLLQKYYIYSSAEMAEMYNEENIRDEKPNINSLKFHLEQRRIMEELGINLPFNL